MATDKRRIYLILGMHRSGTSALTSVLSACGLHLGKHLLEPSFDNPKGFFENRKVIHFNAKLLSILEMNWDSPLVLPENWEAYLDMVTLRLELEEIIQTEFSGEGEILIKDPRLCLILPIWHALLSDYAFEHIIITRPPVDISKSLLARNKIGQDKSNIIWLNHYLQVERFTRAKERIFVDFNKLQSNTKQQCTRLISFIDKDSVKLNEEACKLINNEESSIKQDTSKAVRNQLLDLANEAYAAFLKLTTKQTKKPEERIQKIAQEYHSYYVQFIDSVLRKDDKLFTVIYVDEQGRRNKVLHELKMGDNHFHFQIKSEAKIERIIILPSNDKAYFRLECLEVKNIDQKVGLQKVNSAVLFEHGIEFVVNNTSYFQYALDESHRILDVEVCIKVFALGINTMDSLDVLSQKVNSWIDKNFKVLQEEKSEMSQAVKVQELELEEFKKEHSAVVNKLDSAMQKSALFEGQFQKSKERTKELESINEAHQKEIKAKTDEAHQKELKIERIAAEIQKIEHVQFEYDKAKIHMERMNNELTKYQEEKISQLIIANKKDIEIEVLKLKAEHAEEKHMLKIEQLDQQVQILRKENELAVTDKKAKEEATLQVYKLEIQLAQVQESLKVKNELLIKLEQSVSQQQAALQAKEKEALHLEQVTNQFLQEREMTGPTTSLRQSVMEDSVLMELFDYLDQTNSQSNMQSDLDETNQQYYELKRDLENILQDQSNEIENKDGLIESLQDKINQAAHMIASKEDALERQNEIIKAQRQELLQYKVDFRNTNRDLKDVRESISYKVGNGLMSPAKWVYDRTSGKTPINKSRLWLIKNLLIAGIKNPIASVMKLSPKNLRTLHTAMQSESNETIISNFTKLVNKQNQNSQVESPEYQLQGEKQEVLDAGSQLVVADQKEKSLLNSKPSLRENIIEIDNIAADNTERPKVMYISPNLPDYDTSSGGKRATRMIEMLCEQFDVFVFTYGARPQKYVDKLTSLGAIVIHGNDYTQIKRRIPVINTLIFAWYYSYNDANKLVQLYNDAKIIVDTVDVHWVREERSIGLVEGLSAEKVASNKRKEIEVYKQADIVWTVTENDKQFILDVIPEMQVDVVSNIHDNHVHAYEDSGSNKMLFFGGFNHYPNISAVKNIVENILPLVRKEIPVAELIIAGANATEEIEALGTYEGVDFRGFIEEDELPNLYKESFLSVAPLLAGAGIKGKICESIVYRTPVATNAIGNEGIHMTNLQDGLIAEDNIELANLIARAMKREFDMNSMTHNAQEILKGIVGTETVKRKMFGSIMPEVSICIVTWNRLDLLKRCIESIEGNTIYPYYKILVHSNGCTDGTQQYLEAAAAINKKIVPILSQENEVFVIPNNNMMRMFPDNDSVLVNNDVYVTKGWLMELYKAAYGSPQIGIAGSKILYPDQSLQEFGSELYDNGTGRNIGKHDDPNKDEYKQLQRVGYVSGCSMYIKKKTIEKIGVFDLQFHPCYCEDSDYCYTAWENGIETVVTPNSIIYHDEGGTSGTDEDSGFKAYQKVNFEKFLVKHKENLEEIGEKIKSLN